MRAFASLPLLAMAMTATPARAQDADTAELAELRAMVAELSSRIGVLSERIEELEAEDAAAPAPAAAAAPVVAASGTPAPAPAAQIAWRGAPEVTGEGGWSFKPRGRLQLDAGTVSAPEGIVDTSLGFGSEVRRAYLGVEGRVPGGFGYRAEVDVANSSVEVTDLYITYQASDSLTLMAGQTKPFWGLEELTSDLFTSFNERAALNNAFGYERRLGLNGVWTSGPVIVQAGVFTDNVADLNDDGNNSVSLHGRVVFAPRIGESQLHLAANANWRDLNDAASSVRYRVRPFIHTPDIRFVDTGTLPAENETGYGLEAAWISGPFHAAGEAHWQDVDNGLAAYDPSFFGGYAEVGYFLTGGDTRGYRGGVFDRTRPANPLGDGGFGALQLNLRYDFLDLNSGPVIGGTQDGLLGSLVWIPTAYTRLILNYGHLRYGDAAIATPSGDRDYSVDSLSVRAQIDF